MRGRRVGIFDFVQKVKGEGGEIIIWGVEVWFKGKNSFSIILLSEYSKSGTHQKQLKIKRIVFLICHPKVVSILFKIASYLWVTLAFVM